MGNSIYIHDHLVIYNNSVISPAIGGGSGEKIIYANASGRAFPIWNTIAGDDKLFSLSIHGRTEQDGTPTPEASVPLQSVGDEDLYLYVMQDKEGSNFQTLDIKTAMQNAGHDGILRSVNGIYDEVFYDGKQWKLIQRIQYSSNLEILAEPQEYSLDLPQISTYEGQTYFATNTMEIKPRMVAQCQVSEKLDYIKEGLLGYWTGRERSNTDENRDILPDLSGNGNDLTNYNMAYTPESGYGDGYIQYDGVDDYSNVGWTDIAAKSALLVCEDIVNTKQSPYYSMTSMIGNDRSNFGGIAKGKISPQNDYGYFNSSNLGSELYTKDFSLEKGILNIYIGRGGSLVNNPEFVYNLCIGAGNFYGNPTGYCCKIKIHDFLVYNRKLTNEEIEHNYKVSCQYNGEDFSFDHIKQNLIASYRTYDKTNEDEDRDILKDLSGNGHDIQLHNFAFSKGSGYGLYGDQFDTLKTHNNSVSKTYKKIEVTKELTSYYIVYNQTGVTSLNGMKVKVSNLPKERTLTYTYKEADDANPVMRISIVADGIYDLPGSIKTSEGIQSRDYGFMVDINNITGFVGLTIELIPDYQGALVSDGVDDFGVCDNFPALTKEKGYTVCAIRKWLNIDYTNVSKVFLSTRVYDKNNENPTQWGSFTLEKTINNNNMQVINFGAVTLIENKNILLMQDVFTYLNSKKYKEKEDINIGNAQHTPRLNLFAGYTFLQQPDGRAELSNITLYAIEIYNRDLTDEEIAKVKARMIAEYEEKTGNKYDEENYLTLNTSKLDIAKLK